MMTRASRGRYFSRNCADFVAMSRGREALLIANQYLE